MVTAVTLIAGLASPTRSTYMAVAVVSSGKSMINWTETTSAMVTARSVVNDSRPAALRASVGCTKSTATSALVAPSLPPSPNESTVGKLSKVTAPTHSKLGSGEGASVLSVTVANSTWMVWSMSSRSNAYVRVRSFTRVHPPAGAAGVSSANTCPSCTITVRCKSNAGEELFAAWS